MKVKVFLQVGNENQAMPKLQLTAALCNEI